MCICHIDICCWRIAQCAHLLLPGPTIEPALVEVQAGWLSRVKQLVELVFERISSSLLQQEGLERRLNRHLQLPAGLLYVITVSGKYQLGRLLQMRYDAVSKTRERIVIVGHSHEVRADKPQGSRDLPDVRLKPGAHG